MVAGDEHERPAAVDDPLDEPEFERRAAVRQVAGEEQRAPVRVALEDRDREHVVVQVGGDGELGRSASGARSPGR